MDTRTRRTRRVALVAATGLAIAVLAPAVIGGTGVGGTFTLGRTNTVNRASTLSGSTTGKLLQVTNTGSGTALSLTTQAGVPPMRVSSSTKVELLNADLLDGEHAAAFVRGAGTIQLAIGNASWVKYASADTTTVQVQTVGARWRLASPGSAMLVVSPDLPVALFGEAVQLGGLELCYANAANTTLANVELTVLTSSTGDAVVVSAINDATDRTGANCILLGPAAPIQLDYRTTMSLYLQVSWGVGGQDFTIRRTTLYLTPTGAAATEP